MGAILKFFFSWLHFFSWWSIFVTWLISVISNCFIKCGADKSLVRRRRRKTRHWVAPHVAYNPVTLNPKHLGYMLDTLLVFDNNKMFDWLNIFDSQHHVGHSNSLFSTCYFLLLQAIANVAPFAANFQSEKMLITTIILNIPDIQRHKI